MGGGMENWNWCVKINKKFKKRQKGSGYGGEGRWGNWEEGEITIRIYCMKNESIFNKMKKGSCVLIHELLRKTL